METNYLFWFKNLYQDICHRDDVFSLLSSNVSEPTQMLQNLVEKNRDRLAQLIGTSNEWGHPALLGAIARKQGLSPENIVLCNGASNAIALVCQALLKKGDQVIIEQPVYQPLEICPEFMGAEIIHLKRDPNYFRFDLSRLRDIVTSKTKLFILTNPHNPTGAYLGKAELLQIAAIAKKANPKMKILVDEIYGDFVAEGFQTAASLADCFIVISSLSKVYGLSLLRCGWIAADERTAEKIRKQWAMTEGCGSRILESVSAVVFENADEFLKRSLKISEDNRKILAESLSPLIDQGILSGQMPQYGCIYFPKVKDAEKVAGILRDRHNVYVVPGRFFGASGHLRIGFGGDSRKLTDSLNAFGNCLKALNT